MTNEVVNEASTMTVRVGFKSATNVPTVPLSARYLIKDVTNDRVVRDWTVLTPAASIDITIIASENAIYNDSSRVSRRFEERVITVQANYGTDTQYAQEKRYLIKNLRGFDS